jgi:hypothetical protein
MRDTLKQRLFDLGYGTGSKTPLEAITYIEELELELYEMNELYGAVKDGLEEKLAKAMEALRLIASYDIGVLRGLAYIANTALAELEAKE